MEIDGDTIIITIITEISWVIPLFPRMLSRHHQDYIDYMLSLVWIPCTKPSPATGGIFKEANPRNIIDLNGKLPTGEVIEESTPEDSGFGKLKAKKSFIFGLLKIPCKKKHIYI